MSTRRAGDYFLESGPPKAPAEPYIRVSGVRAEGGEAIFLESGPPKASTEPYIRVSGVRAAGGEAIFLESGPPKAPTEPYIKVSGVHAEGDEAFPGKWPHGPRHQDKWCLRVRRGDYFLEMATQGPEQSPTSRKMRPRAAEEPISWQAAPATADSRSLERAAAEQ